MGNVLSYNCTNFQLDMLKFGCVFTFFFCLFGKVYSLLQLFDSGMKPSYYFSEFYSDLFTDSQYICLIDWLYSNTVIFFYISHRTQSIKKKVTGIHVARLMVSITRALFILFFGPKKSISFSRVEHRHGNVGVLILMNLSVNQTAK